MVSNAAERSNRTSAVTLPLTMLHNTLLGILRRAALKLVECRV